MNIIRRFAYKKLGIIDYYEQIMNDREKCLPRRLHICSNPAIIKTEGSDNTGRKKRPEKSGRRSGAMEPSSKRQNIIKAAKLYYYGNMSQEEIAQVMGISRPKVSRLLAEGRQLNIVQVVIQDPGTSLANNAERIKNHYKLDFVKVVPTQNTAAATMALIGREASAFLNENIQEESLVGITWGNTINTFVHEFRAKRPMPKATVVQLVGGLYSHSMNFDVREVAKDLARKLECPYSILQSPMVVHNPKLRDMFMEEPSVKEHFRLVRRAQMAFVGVGSANYKDSVARQANFINERDAQILSDMGLVGDICGHQLMPDGTEPETFFSRRLISVALEDLHCIPMVIGLCEGKKKVAPLRAALRGRHLNGLITDEVAAIALIAEEHL